MKDDPHGCRRFPVPKSPQVGLPKPIGNIWETNQCGQRCASCDPLPGAGYPPDGETHRAASSRSDQSEYALDERRLEKALRDHSGNLMGGPTGRKGNEYRAQGLGLVTHREKRRSLSRRERAKPCLQSSVQSQKGSYRIETQPVGCALMWCSIELVNSSTRGFCTTRSNKKKSVWSSPHVERHVHLPPQNHFRNFPGATQSRKLV